MTTPRARAEAAQRTASDPGVSAFVAASAGSGKTKLLVDRLLRLMLAGAPPGRIQCLTFTKAAAAEMAVRLQTRLGEWVTLDDLALDARLADLNVPPAEEVRQRARALFADVLDLPGGMRIGTIHAFCQSLLRRFPLEAALSPHFGIVDDLEAAIALADAREAMLSGAWTERKRADLALLAGLVREGQFSQLVKSLLPHAEHLAPDDGAYRRILGVAAASDADLIAAAVAWPGEAAIAAALRTTAEHASDAVRTKALRLLDFLALAPDARALGWAVWRDEFLLPDGAPRKPGAFLNKKLADSRPDLLDAFLLEQSRVDAVEDTRRALRVARVSAALARLALPVAQAYTAHKEAAFQLDYDDLVARTVRLLVDPGAAWVLYKLDGGLDHLLLDEVQDTAPAQWAIAGALTAEFFAGQGARPGERTVFAVGDRKQSIYGFQGADPDQFETWRQRMRAQVEQAGAKWRDVSLDVSFRSTTPVLNLVDAVFANPRAAAGVTDGTAMTHLSNRDGHAGRVEIWPLVPPPSLAPPTPWSVPERNENAIGAPERLAEALADWIAARCGDEPLPSQGRTLGPGDVLVLLRRRKPFAQPLVRALKARGVPVAGLDRLVLTEQPAVADLLTLCDALLLPDDDLSVAAVLTSPFGGLDDDDLIALAPHRAGSLWAELRRRKDEPGRDSWRRAHDLFATLLARVDFVSPHALLSEALGPLAGRAKLLGRLGAEAAEPIDELLQAALDYTRLHPPSLQGFTHWLRHANAEVKRQAEGGGGAVRVMTVHSAKGLQAPLVILPDTTTLPPTDGRLVWDSDPLEGALPLWVPNKDFRCRHVEALQARNRARDLEEQNRLLYVALTRAEDRLIVGGWETRNRQPGCWYDLIREGAARLGASEAPFAGGWEGSTLIHDRRQTVPPDIAPARPAEPGAALPGWIGAARDWAPSPPPPEPALPDPLAPSRPENATLGDVPGAASPLLQRDSTGRRFLRGQVIHQLLQHLPAVAPPQRDAVARGFLARPGHGISAEEARGIASDVLAVLDDPAIAPLFGPHGRAEVPVTGLVAGQVVGGVIDRLAVLPDSILLADYKTNRAPPTDPDRVPVLYLRQMAAYRAVLRAALPGRRVDCLLIWTEGARAMSLPESLLDRHAPGEAPTP